MSALNDLIAQVKDDALRTRIQEEADRAIKQKKFGLVFEEHLPESVRLYDVPIKSGTAVVEKTEGKTVYKVSFIRDGVAECIDTKSQETKSFPVSDLVAIAQFGTPIYPYLKPIDSVCNAPDSDLWHTLIEADNYHALQLLEYLYAGKVDCIYIDPPYNTGARDWKYNNDYVDGADEYRHSKWLSFIQRRLALAKKLLNPKDSVLIVTIDEKEYHHLACLLEQMFPEARIQMVSVNIHPGGVARDKEFARSDEYIYFVKFGSSGPQNLVLNNDWLLGIESTSRETIHWRGLLRSGSNDSRSHSPGCFYPIYVSENGEQIISIGEPLAIDQDRLSIQAPEGQKVIFPIHTDGSEGVWQCSPSVLSGLLKKGYVKLGGFTNRGMSINYLAKGEQKKVEAGLFTIIGKNKDGSIIVNDEGYQARFIPTTQWLIKSHDALRNGTGLLNKILGGKVFSYPKSLYAVHDTLRFFVANKTNALILDFFAGSGTTLHAVNLLNAEDGGKRRCIMVTNNEVSAEEAKRLSDKGHQPGDKEWEGLGIAHYVTWPRTVCSIKGVDINGQQLKGNYISDKEIPMSDGFKANAVFFKLGFLDKNAVALGRQFRELIPVLWMKAGAIGKCPELKSDVLPDWLILPENKMAVLINENVYPAFKNEMLEHSEIQTLFIVTDFEREYTIMANELGIPNTFQLYRDYLDNFRINHNR